MNMLAHSRKTNPKHKLEEVFDSDSVFSDDEQTKKKKLAVKENQQYLEDNNHNGLLTHKKPCIKNLDSLL